MTSPRAGPGHTFSGPITLTDGINVLVDILGALNIRIEHASFVVTSQAGSNGVPANLVMTLPDSQSRRLTSNTEKSQVHRLNYQENVRVKG